MNIDVRQLYESAQAEVIDQTITVSTSQTGTFSTVSDALAIIFNAIDSSFSSFQISMADLRFDEQINIFSIHSQKSREIYPGYFFQCISFSPSMLTLTCKIDNRSLDEDGKLMVFHCIKSFSVEYDVLDISDEITGILPIGKAQLTLKGSRNPSGAWEYQLTESGKLPAGALLSGFFELFSIPMFLNEEKIPLRFSYIKAVFKENSNWQAAISNDSFAIEAAVDCSLDLEGILTIDSLVFYFEKYGCDYSLHVKGMVSVLALQPLEFIARYSSGTYLFGVNAKDRPAFGLETAAQLTGAETKDTFPEKIAKAQGLRLSELTVCTDFSKVQSFKIGLLWDENWVICQQPNLALSDIGLWMYIAGEKKSYGIEGMVTLFEKNVNIKAAYETESGWMFQGQLSPYTPLKLQNIAENTALLFGIPDFTLPLDLDVVNLSVAIGLSGEFELSGLVLAGGSKDTNLATIFNGKCKIHIKKEPSKNASENTAGLTAEIDGIIYLCGNRFELKYESKEKNRLTAEFEAGSKEELSFKALLNLFGNETLSDMLPDCFDLSIARLSLSYEFAEDKKELLLQSKLNAFDVDAVFSFGSETDYTITISIHSTIDMSGIPVAGAVLEGLGADASISGFTLTFSKKEGFLFGCDVCGQHLKCVLALPAAEPKSNESGSGFIKWLTVNKSIGVFHLNRLGISLKESKLGILADVSLLVNPFTFELLGAGIEADVPSLHNPKFLLEGFDVDFCSASLSVAGGFRHSNDSYTGEIKAATGNFSIAVLGEYSNNGITAYAVLSCPLGGPPCFTVTGLAAAFGYNRNLRLPDIERVTDYPLVAAAVHGYDRTNLISRLQEYMTDDCGERFLAAGVKFTSFEIVKGFALLTVAFGQNTQIGLLGLADIVMPPNCDKTPIARAQLTLKAAVSPALGVISCEARLTDASYLFSRSCKLQGGFALYVWFAGNHKGDFVVTLGGYHPAYHKPDHYPDVPRIGFNWDVLPVHNRLVLSGELYFALTPSAIMAGGKLSAVYSYGHLRAYFIAYADFLLQWKPFTYDIRLGILLGASYRMDVWFIHHTFTIELAADLHIWGPEFSGKAHISWYIISFTIHFGNTPKENVPPLEWEEFRDSFIPSGSESKTSPGDTKDSPNPFSISLTGAASDTTVRADDFSASIHTVIPIKRANLSGKEMDVYKKELPIRPMNGALTDSLLTIRLIENRGKKQEKERQEGVTYSFIYGNVPSALWAQKDTAKELVEDVPVGISLHLQEYVPKLFPEEGEISEELLKDTGKLEVTDAFETAKTPACQTYEHKSTVAIFQKTAKNVESNGMELLKSLGFTGTASLTRYADNADNLFDDDILIGSIENEICG